MKSDSAEVWNGAAVWLFRLSSWLECRDRVEKNVTSPPTGLPAELLIYFHAEARLTSFFFLSSPLSQYYYFARRREEDEVQFSFSDKDRRHVNTCENMRARGRRENSWQFSSEFFIQFTFLFCCCASSCCCCCSPPRHTLLMICVLITDIFYSWKLIIRRSNLHRFMAEKWVSDFSQGSINLIEWILLEIHSSSPMKLECCHFSLLKHQHSSSKRRDSRVSKRESQLSGRRIISEATKTTKKN